MTENEALNFMRIEKECINRNCDRNCFNCDIVQEVDNLNGAYDMAIKALKEIQQYRRIGTPEECREAMDRQNPKKPVMVETDAMTTKYICPACGCLMGWATGPFPDLRYCSICGQKLDMEDA